MNNEEQRYKDLQGIATLNAKYADRNRSQANFHTFRNWVGNVAQANSECTNRSNHNESLYDTAVEELRAMEFRNPNLSKLRTNDLKY